MTEGMASRERAPPAPPGRWHLPDEAARLPCACLWYPALPSHREYVSQQPVRPTRAPGGSSPGPAWSPRANWRRAQWGAGVKVGAGSAPPGPADAGGGDGCDGCDGPGRDGPPEAGAGPEGRTPRRATLRRTPSWRHGAMERGGEVEGRAVPGPPGSAWVRLGPRLLAPSSTARRRWHSIIQPRGRERETKRGGISRRVSPSPAASIALRKITPTVRKYGINGEES